MVWHGYLPGRAAGAALRLSRPRARTSPRGHRFNANKVVLDPYAKAIGRDVRWGDALFGYQRRRPGRGPLVRRARQRGVRAAGRGGRSRVHLGRRPPAAHAWHETVIYELHVKGFTQLPPEIPEQLRGTYAGPGVATR